MNLRILTILSSLLLFLWGCSNATPQIGMLTNISTGLEFSPSLITTASWGSVSISGKCSTFVDSVDLSFDGGQTWYSSQALDTNASGCSSGTFTMTLTNSKAPLSNISFTSGQMTNVQFRAHTKFNTNIESLLQIQFTPASQRKQEVLIGSTISQDTGNTMILTGRARMQQQSVATGGSYQLRGWVR